ncbi:hypothetical protein A6X21_15825 [Planctopirus hydrillae]|uniref:Knr4/Smi1-like domain-containing protein n=2 Tax=Planctopirus hydrillae TaxID=1841610 RepID=A0A1C3ETN3_9PLAN|nr:hypothetical protein A6X21_15825 [Planctopirus hydrillae]
MMANEHISKLGAKLLGQKSNDLEEAIKSAERVVPMTPNYREILLEFGGAIWFDHGARYKPHTPNPFTKKDGYNNLEILFGLGNDKNSIEQKASQYKDELPPSFVPIGESSGGNLVCVNSDASVHFWDHESQRNEGTWRIAASIDEFLKRLEPDDSGIGSTEGIIESESFLDF